MDARLENRLCRKLVADACGNKRVGMEGGEVARIHARDNRLRGCIAERFCHNLQLAEIVFFANFHEGLHVKTLGALRHLDELFVIQDACNQQDGVGAATVSDVDFVFIEQEILAEYRAGMQLLRTAQSHQVRYRNQVVERALEKIAFGQYRNRLGVSFRVGVRELERIQVRSDIALRRRCALDFENRSRVTEKFRMANAALFRNVDAEIQAQLFDVGFAHPHDLRKNIFTHFFALTASS